MTKFHPGTLYRAVSKSAAMKTNPWGTTDRTITRYDHACIATGDIVLLVEYHDVGGAGIYIWLLGPRVVWQVLEDGIFKKCWKQINLNLEVPTVLL